MSKRFLHINPTETLNNVTEKINNLLYNDVDEDVSMHDPIQDMDDAQTILSNIVKNDIDLHDYYNEDEIKDLKANDGINEAIDNVSDDEISSGLQIMQVDKDSTLYQYLLDWYGRDELGANNAIKLMKSKIRAYYDFNFNYFYYATGVGYDTISSDLLGFDCDGAARDFFNNYFVYGNDDKVDKDSYVYDGKINRENMIKKAKEQTNE